MAALIVNDVTPRNQYAATAGQATFIYSFPIFADSDLKVYHTLSGATADDAADILALTTDYTVTGAGDTDGGTVVLNSGAAIGDIITIVRDVPVARTTDYQTAGDFLADTVNDDMDKLVMMVQQQEDSLASRILKFQESSNLSGVSTKLPTPVANEFLRWNAALTALEGVKIEDISGIAVSTFMQTVLDDTTAAAARTTLGTPGLTDANTFTKTQTWTKGADVASATTLTLGDGNIFDITGTTTITSIATKGVGTTVILQFDGVLQLTHNATTLVLPNGNNITTAAGDVLCFNEYSTGNWRLVSTSSTALFALTANNLSDLASASTARTNLGLGALATLDTVNQSLIDTNAIGQAEIKLNNQDVSNAHPANGGTTTVILTAPSYTYRGVWGWRSGLSGTGYTSGFSGGAFSGETSPTQLIGLYNNNDGSGGVIGTGYARCYYVNSSPPYVSADGEILLFMFGIVDNGTGFLESVATSIDPPWMYNGSTKTVADVKGENGEYFIRKRLIDVEIPNWREMQVTGSLSNRRMISRRLKQDGFVYVPIDQSIKNADMNEVPHPFVNVPAGKTVVYLDPVSPVMQDLYEHHILARNDTSAPAAAELLHNGYIVIDPQSDLNRDKPTGLKCVSLRWK